MTTETTVVVIGAGPAGLAASQCLTRNDLDHVVLERNDTVASSWRRHYDRLHLHTVKRHSALPDRPFPDADPKYPSREQVIRYFDDYASHFGVSPTFGVEVRRAHHDGSRWIVETSGDTFHAASLVVASGYNAVPNIPESWGLADFEGPVVHSREYTNGAMFAEQRVLVVGCGNSGAEIVLDLVEHEARPSMVVRGPVHVVPRDLLGRPSQATSIALSRFSATTADRLAGPLLRIAVGDLSRYGIVRPSEGPRTMIEKYGRVPILDIGTIAAIKRGDADVVPGVRSVGTSDVTFDDGTTRPYEAIVLATGYRCGLDRFLEDSKRVTDDNGRPLVFGEETEIPGLYFVGFKNPPTGALREIAIEAPRVADSIRQRVDA